VARLWGRDPGKPGGAEYRADPEISDDRGGLTCGRCNGVGQLVRRQLRVDEDDTFAEYDEKTCPTCGGSGAVSA
jgi:DnaJ-class molecular chaperone